MKKLKVVLFANTDWYLFNFRMSLIRKLREDGHEVLLLSPAGPYGARLRALGFRWIPVPMQRRSLHPVRETRLVWWLSRLLRRERPNLVHNLTIKCAVYGSIAARLAGVSARVNAVNGLGYVFTSEDRLARALRLPVRSLMRLAFAGKRSRVVVQNPDDRGVFERSGLVPPDCLRLIPGSGVDCQRFAPRAPRATAEAEFRVLLPARLLKDKGVVEFVEVARRLKGSGISFLIAGDADPGNPAAIGEAETAQWSAEGLVQLLGHVDDMPALFNTVDLVCLPSYREGLPRALIEAAACGLPLVATDVPGCREVITDGVDGLLVPVRDAAALAAAIARLRADPELAARLGRRARRQALDRFDEKRIVAETLAVYAEIASGSVDRGGAGANRGAQRTRIS